MNSEKAESFGTGQQRDLPNRNECRTKLNNKHRKETGDGVYAGKETIANRASKKYGERSCLPFEKESTATLRSFYFFFCSP